MKIKTLAKVFFSGFIMMILIMIPEMFVNSGYFLFAGDYSFQQIPFSYHASEMLKSIQSGWDWMTDLGTDFIGSYGFYLIGSVFFRVICWLPGKFVILAMPFMTALKTGTAALTSYIYIHRYVKKDISAYLGAVMYAFSGFQMFNVIYNHFHDVTALFPLLLLSFDLLVQENKKCFFALMTALAALTNYFFFYGEVVFIILYYILRCVKKDFRFSVGNFLSILTEALLGVSIAAVLLLPEFVFIYSGERISDFLTGTELVSYSDNTIIPKIFQSIFITPDMPSFAKLFQSDENPNNWASVSLYIPFFASVGVASYFKQNTKNWITCLLSICLLAACIPVFNSAFYMFNSSYYARWYYMPVLFMCIATVVCIDYNYDLKPGIKFQASGLLVLSIIAMFPRKVIAGTGDLFEMIDENSASEEKIKFFSMSEIPEVFWQSIAFGVIFLAFIYVYSISMERDEFIIKKLTAFFIVMIIVTNIIYLNDIEERLKVNGVKESSVDFIPELNENSGFFRVNGLHGLSMNFNMLWGLNPAGSYHSIVPNESEKFYSEIQGKIRNMNSGYEQEDYPVYGLLSVKYIFNRSTGDDLNVEFYPADIKGFRLYDKQGYYYIYENEHFVPVGNMYDYCISESRLDEILDKFELEEKDRFIYKKMIMMRALVISEEDKEKYAEYIKEIPEKLLYELDENTYFDDCDARARHACLSFEYDSKGYMAEINADKAGLVYFSVPFTSGWNAKVNGKEVDAIKVHYGLTAIPVDQGNNRIECTYETPGLKQGIYISITGLLAFIVYSLIVITEKFKKRELKT